MDLKDPLVTCPIEPSHRVRASVLSRHLYRCRKNNPQYKEAELQQCPLNATHLHNPDTFHHHLETCESSVNVMEAVYVTEDSRQVGIPIEEACSKETIVTLQEDWSGTSGQGGYDPEKNSANRSVLRSAVGLSKVKKREFKNAERMRMAKLSDANSGASKEEKTLDVNKPLRPPKNPAKALTDFPRNQNPLSKHSSIDSLISKLAMVTTASSSCSKETQFESSSSNDSLEEEKSVSKFDAKENKSDLSHGSLCHPEDNLSLTDSNDDIVGHKSDSQEVKSKSYVHKSDNDKDDTVLKNVKKENIEFWKKDDLSGATSSSSEKQGDFPAGKSNCEVPSPNSETLISEATSSKNSMEIPKAESLIQNPGTSGEVSFTNPRCAASFQQPKLDRRVGCGRGFRIFYENAQQAEKEKKTERECSTVFGYGDEEELDFEDVDWEMKMRK